MAWGQAYDAALASETQAGLRGTFPWYHTTDRERDFYMSASLLETRSSVFYHAERTPELGEVTEVSELASFRGLRITSYEYAPALKDIMDGAPEEPTNLKAFERLLADPQVHFVVEAEEVGTTILRDRFPQGRKIIRTAPIHWDIGVHFLASRNNPHNRRLIERFDEALKQMRSGGSYQALVSRVQDQIRETRTVTLHSFAPESFLQGYPNANRRASVLLPEGTRAIVDDWGEAYLAPVAPSTNPQPPWVRVVLLNGPLKGTFLHVDGRAVRLP